MERNVGEFAVTHRSRECEANPFKSAARLDLAKVNVATADLDRKELILLIRSFPWMC